MAARAPKKKRASSGLTKAAILTEIASQAGLTKSQVDAVFGSFIAIAYRELKSPRKVVIVPGLGKMHLRVTPARPARMGRKPGSSTGEMVQFAAKKAGTKVKFGVSKAFRDQF
jgi:nucleoid DNA-binding protein